MSWTAIAETSRPEMRASNSTPLGPQDPHDEIAVPQKEPEDDAHGDQRRGKGDRVRCAVDSLDEKHGRDDGPRSC